MKFKIETKAALSALTPASQASTTSPIAILRNAKIVAAQGRVSFTGTNLDKTIESSCPAEVEQEGSTTVPSARFVSALKSFSQGSTFSLVVKDGGATILAGRSRFVLPCLPIEDFPQKVELEQPIEFTIPSAKLLEAMIAVRHAVCRDGKAYYLAGCYMHASDGMLKIVATDTHRLASFDTGVAVPDDLPAIILPDSAIDSLISVLPSGAECSVSISNSGATFSIGSTVLTSKIIDGTYPNYQRVIPQELNEGVLISCADILASMTRMNIVEGSTGDASFAIGNGKVAVQSTGDGLFAADDEIDAEYDGEAKTIHFNVKYICDTIAALESDTVRIRWPKSGSPSLFTAPGKPDRVMLIMPTRLKGK